MGGLAPLGYDIRDSRLIIDETEAKPVRQVFRRYASLRSVRAFKKELDEAGIVSKLRLDRFGRQTGGRP